MKWTTILFSLGMVLVIAACGNIEESPEVETPIEEETKEEEPIVVENEPETEELTIEEDQHTFKDIVKEYQVLSTFDTDGPGTGLGLGMHVLYEEEGVALVTGHQGHALAHYRLLQVDNEAQKVIVTHQFSEEHEIFEEIQRMIEKNGEKAAFDWMKEQDSNFDELFFSSEIPPETTTVTWNDQEWEAIEVEIKDGDEKYVFAIGKGLVQIHYQSEIAQEVFGEVRVANRIKDE